jgi:thymidylate synthase (FAD)
MYSIPLQSSYRQVFKKGFVKLIDCMPRQIPNDSRKLMCDSAIVQAARVSYGQGLKDYETDSKLINYLFKHKHTSPFEMVKFKFHVKAPIFVARQWFRHRMASYNEISGRYSELKEDIYFPDKISSQSKINKQLSSDDDISNNIRIKNIVTNTQSYNKIQYYNYKELIKLGVSREIARVNLPVSLFTEFYFCIDLHNLLNFIKLRNSKNAQYEIKEYASKIQEIIEPLCPITMKAYHNNKTITLSKDQIKSLSINKNLDNLSNREKNEILNNFII